MVRLSSQVNIKKYVYLLLLLAVPVFGMQNNQEEHDGDDYKILEENASPFKFLDVLVNEQDDYCWEVFGVSGLLNKISKDPTMVRSFGRYMKLWPEKVKKGLVCASLSYEYCFSVFGLGKIYALFKKAKEGKLLPYLRNGFLKHFTKEELTDQMRLEFQSVAWIDSNDKEKDLNDRLDSAFGFLALIRPDQLNEKDLKRGVLQLESDFKKIQKKVTKDASDTQKELSQKIISKFIPVVRLYYNAYTKEEYTPSDMCWFILHNNSVRFRKGLEHNKKIGKDIFAEFYKLYKTPLLSVAAEHNAYGIIKEVLMQLDTDEDMLKSYFSNTGITLPGNCNSEEIKKIAKDNQSVECIKTMNEYFIVKRLLDNKKEYLTTSEQDEQISKKAKISNTDKLFPGFPQKVNNIVLNYALKE